MGTFFSFLGTYLLSLLVATVVAQSFAEFFHSGEEFIGVLILLPAFGFVSIAAFGVAYAVGNARAIGWTAIGLVALAPGLFTVMGVMLSITTHTTNPFAMSDEDLATTLELLVPILIMVPIQWGLARRRWLRSRGLQDLSRWPWIATIVAGIALFNPSTLALLGSTIHQTPNDWLRGFFALVLAGTAATLIAMAAIEYYVRGRILRRRPTAT